MFTITTEIVWFGYSIGELKSLGGDKGNKGRLESLQWSLAFILETWPNGQYP